MIKMHPYSLFTATNLVICFHHIPSKEWFHSALAAIRSCYRFVSADELEGYFYESRRFNSRCLLRFDDGDRSFYEHAFPVLKDLALPAILFVSPRVLNGGSNYWFQDMARFQQCLPDSAIKETIGAVTGWPVDEIVKYDVLALSKSLEFRELQKVLERLGDISGAEFESGLNISDDELREISRSGVVTVGAHTMNHPILANEEDSLAAAEISRSISELSRVLDKEVRHFAYPNGLRELDFGEREKRVLKAKGVKLAYSGETGFFGRRTDPFEIPCLGASGDRGSRRLWLTAKFLLAPVWKRVRSDKQARERRSIQRLLRNLGGLPETSKTRIQ